jgi:uncharacterized protein
MTVQLSPRSQRIDALRGIAVFGILLVNVWGMATGAIALRYGVLANTAPMADRLAIFFAAAFAEGKFYPIFAFLFGAGFALQMRSLKRTEGGWESAKAIYRRRLRWLLACGLLHGTLLWYGDILTAYSVAGFWLLRAAGRRLSEVRCLLKIAVVVTALLVVFMLVTTIGFGEPSVADVNETVYAARRSSAIFAQGGWREIGLERVKNFGSSIASLIFFLPEVVMLFLLGVLAIRLGWLTQPERHRAFWRKVQVAGLGIGIPFNVWWGWAALAEARDPYTYGTLALLAHLLLTAGGLCLAAGYVATFMTAGERTTRRVATWFAPVGRMALSNYLIQSVIGVAVLQGVGLGLGATLSRAGLLGFCACLMAFQLVLSRWWLARYTQGPLEALWRRYTYRR